MTRTIPEGLTRAGRCALVCEAVPDKMLEAVYIDGGLATLIKFISDSMTIASAYDFMKVMRSQLAQAVNDVHQFRAIVLTTLSEIDDVISNLEPKETKNATIN